MPKKDNEQSDNCFSPPRVIADFGGRRKTFERRISTISMGHGDRRNDQDRRSGFDRRGVFPQNPDHNEHVSEKRKNPSESTSNRKADGSDIAS